MCHGRMPRVSVAMVFEWEQLVGGVGDGAIGPRCPLCRCRRARDAEVVFEHGLACRDLAEQGRLLESAAAQQAAGIAEQ